jgi:hypothetical protein
LALTFALLEAEGRGLILDVVECAAPDDGLVEVVRNNPHQLSDVLVQHVVDLHTDRNFSLMVCPWK